MLHSLHVQNYAIIDELDIQFHPGLNIMTGETGAGKSILLGALSLILGERADSSVLKQTNAKCIVEGIFHIKDQAEQVSHLLEKWEIEDAEELIVRRELSAQGKSRAFINDTPVNLQQLKELSASLVDLHQQFDTLEIASTAFQLKVLDAMAGNQPRLNNYQQTFKKWQLYRDEWKRLESMQMQQSKEIDYNQFLLDELTEINLQPNELEKTDQELQWLSQTESVKAVLASLQDAWLDSDNALLPKLKQQIQQLQPFAVNQPNLQQAYERLQSLYTEWTDIASDIQTVNDDINYDAEKINQMQERLNAGYKLLKKHGVQTTDDLLAIQSKLDASLQAHASLDEDLERAKKQTEVTHQQLLQEGKLLSDARKEQIPILTKSLDQLLKKVGMPNASIQVALERGTEQLDGLDQIDFLFDANKSGKFEKIQKVASGGELSRLMLCIKSLVAEKVAWSTMIFDEIDTGISGEAAKQVADIMKSMGKNRQIICITHQPQIAGKADAHFYLYKEEQNKVINTRIRTLDEAGRTMAIAKMLSGENPSEAALNNAREMMR